MNKFKSWVLLAVCALALNANAALFEDDDARRAILDLRQKFEASQQRSSEELRKGVDENIQLRRNLLNLSNQIEALRTEMATLRGQNEQLTRSVGDIQRVQKEVTQGMEYRLRKVEPGKVSIDGREFLAEPVEKQEFESALTILRKGDFSTAQSSFTSFTKRYPQSGYKSSALFWMGNAQYALRDYKSAIVTFRSLISLDPDHIRAPEALLSMANCQVELKDLKAVRKTLEELTNTYPQSEAASVAKERLSKIK